eukprot:3643589-Amphidinium_carterae.1
MSADKGTSRRLMIRTQGSQAGKATGPYSIGFFPDVGRGGTGELNAQEQGGISAGLVGDDRGVGDASFPHTSQPQLRCTALIVGNLV